MSRLRTAANPESSTITYTYDDNGNLLTKADSRVTTTLTYDSINRPTAKSYSDGTPTVSYYYDSQTLPSGAPSYTHGYATGRLLACIYGSGSEGTYRGYDEMGQVVRQYQRTDSVNYLVEGTYNLNGSVASEIYPSVPGASDRRTVSFSYDNAARLSSLSSSAKSYAPAASVSSISYGPTNALTSQTYGNNLIHAVSYNSRQQPSEIKLGTSSNATSVVDLNYSYGTTANNGNLQSVTYAGGGLSYTQSFTYDSLNRLSAATETNGGTTNWSQTNAYDRYGNRQIDYGGGTYNLGFSNTTNRITTSGYSYDSSGNLTNDTNHAYTFDAENKIKTVDSTTAYTYDGEGQRVRKLLTGDNTRFVYGIGGALVAEFDGSSGNLKKEYVNGPSLITIEPTAVNSNGAQYSMSDHLGSPRVVTNSSAGVVSRHDYLPFGEELGAGTGGRTTAQGYSASDGVRQKWAGKEQDNETGLDYFGARYYANTQGRFTSVDPVAGSCWNPQSLNGYSYAWNNPLVLTDPTGMTVSWEDSEKKKKKNEAEARTDAQRKYEKHIQGLLNSKSAKDRAEGQKLQTQYERLQKSDITFHVVKENPTDASSGELTYAGKEGHLYVNLKGNSNEYAALTDVQKLAHEFTHGEQFLDGKIGFITNDSKTWHGLNDDLPDEAEAFIAGFDAQPLDPAQRSNKFLNDVEAARSFGLDAVINVLAREGPYTRRSREQRVITDKAVNVYAIPRHK